MSYTFEKEESSYGLLKEGKYECLIDRIEIKTFDSGKQCINITYKVRDDVEQEHQNRLIFESIWKEKDNPDFFNRKRINKILGTQKVEPGATFNDINDILNLLKGSLLMCNVKARLNEYTGQDENYVSYYESTKYPFATLGSNSDDNIEIIDDDLPF